MTEPKTPTPRTDFAEQKVTSDAATNRVLVFVEADFARQLERELTAALAENERVGKLRDEYGQKYAKSMLEIHTLRARVKELEAEIGDDNRELDVAWKRVGELEKDKERLDWLEDAYHRPEFLLSLSQDARQAIDASKEENS